MRLIMAIHIHRLSYHGSKGLLAVRSKGKARARTAVAIISLHRIAQTACFVHNGQAAVTHGDKLCQTAGLKA